MREAYQYHCSLLGFGESVCSQKLVIFRQQTMENPKINQCVLNKLTVNPSYMDGKKQAYGKLVKIQFSNNFSNIQLEYNKSFKFHQVSWDYY